MITIYSNDEFEDAKSDDLLPLRCEQCQNVFYAKKKLIKHELTHKRGRCRFCSQKCHHLFYSKQDVNTTCKECGKELSVKYRAYKNSLSKNFFCSSSCSAKYNNKTRGHLSNETKNKISNSIKHFYSVNSGDAKQNRKAKIRKVRLCTVCGSEYYLGDNGSTRKVCSRECSIELREHRKKYLSKETIERLSISGRKSVEKQSEIRRSKNEMYFCNLCESEFTNVFHNKAMFNGWDADVILNDLKVAVLWNGIWHYKQIKKKASLEQIQNRDRIKIKEIIKCGYTPYIIADKGKYNKSFVEDEYKKFKNHLIKKGFLPQQIGL